MTSLEAARGAMRSAVCTPAAAPSNPAGFASALADLGLGNGVFAVLRSLVAFNTGVEAGQLAVTACALPVWWVLRRRPAYARYAVPGCSIAAASIGVVWLLERTVG